MNQICVLFFINKIIPKCNSKAPNSKKTIPIHDVIGNTTETTFGGTLKFEIDGKSYTLDATLEGEDDLFLYNNKSNKVYKFMLAEVDPANATPKKSI